MHRGIFKTSWRDETQSRSVEEVGDLTDTKCRRALRKTPRRCAGLVDGALMEFALSFAR